MKTILFLHGWGGNENSFALVKKYFENEYRVLSPVMPCPPEEVWTMREYADCIKKYLSDNNVDNCYVIAHSFGARVVSILASENKELFDKIIITGGAGLRPRFNLNIWLKIVLYKIRKKIFGYANGGSKDYIKLTDNGKATFNNIIKNDLSVEISKIQNPTLLITGEKDKATPVYMAKRWTKLSASARYKIYKNAGHFAYLEQSTKFIKDVREFFNA